MTPNFLVPETVVRSAGIGTELDIGEAQGTLLLITLGITRIVEQESLDVAILGSVNGTDWLPKPLVSFPQKFYCGVYQILLDLKQYPDVRYIKARWDVNRWGRGRPILSSESTFSFRMQVVRSWP